MDDVMPTTDQLLDDVRLRGVSRDVAVERVVGFAQQFGEAHLALACHAAFPLALTPDLLYRIWANFVPQAPWTAIADVLLSPLCREVGHELYEMDIAVRNLLLKELKEDERFGQQRLNELADFLTDYIAQQLYNDDPDVRDLAQAQQWTALAYTQPGEAAREIAEALSELVSEYDGEHGQEGRAELIRVASLVETFAEPLAEFWLLLVYARGIANFARGDLKGAATQLSRVLGQGRQVQVTGVSLPIPRISRYEAVDELVRFGAPEQPDMILLATWQREKGIEYVVIKHGLLPVDGGFVPLTSGEDASVVELWKDLSDLLSEVVQLFDVPSENELKLIWRRFRNVGRYLYETFLSDELRRYSSTWPVGSIVVINTNEHWIPWELIHDGDDFWGNKFILARSPRIPDPSAFSDSDKIMEQPTSTELRKIVNVIGGGLGPPQIVERVRELFSAFRANISIVDIEEATLEKVFQSIADADIVHFTCHGYTTPSPSLQLTDGPPTISYVPLTPTDLQYLPELAGSIVFVNACTPAVSTFFQGEVTVQPLPPDCKSGGSTVRIREDLINFGWEFYKKGVAAYIGTLDLVPIEYAVAFAEQFYERLLSGYTVGASLHYAKSKAARKNPFWLFYVLYGNPFTRIRYPPLTNEGKTKTNRDVGVGLEQSA